MGLPHTFTKALTANSATNIAQSQSPGAGAILLNGSTSNRLSTTTTAATAAGLTVLSMTSVTGLVQGQPVSDSTTAGVIPAGTTVLAVDATNLKVVLSRPVGGAGVGSGDTVVFGGIATLDTQRRVILVSGGNDSGITFTVNGTNDAGAAISEAITGANVGTATSNLDFKTVTSITHTGSVAGTLTVGTNTVGASPWFPLNVHAQPFNLALATILQSGAANWSIQYTYDDPNNLPPSVSFPTTFLHQVLNNLAVNTDGVINDPVAAFRLVINSGTGTVRCDWIEAGISGQ